MHEGTMWIHGGEDKEEQDFFYLKGALRKWHSSHPLFAATKHGGYQCGRNDFF